MYRQATAVAETAQRIVNLLLLPKFSLAKLFPIGNYNLFTKFFDDQFLPLPPAKFSYNFNRNRDAEALSSQLRQFSNTIFILRAFRHKILFA